MYVLDTDMLSKLHAGDVRLRTRQAQFNTEQVVTTVISRIEILQGRFDFLLKAVDGEQLLRAFAWLARSEELLRQIIVLPIGDDAATRFDQLRLNKKLKKIGRADLLIAAITLARDATIVTRNTRHFQQVPGLAVENWID
jgi:tRNA(fMet)-specific endonuclease VapC